MSLQAGGLEATGALLPNDNSFSSASRSELSGIEDKTEVHMGSLGLGAALAVAYDLYGDSGVPPQISSHFSSPQLAGFLSISNMKSSPLQVTQQLAPYVRTAPATVEQQYALYSTQISTGSSNPTNGWGVSHSDAYLTPIAVSSSAFSYVSPSRPFVANASDMNKLPFSGAPFQQSGGCTSAAFADSTPTVSVVFGGSYSPCPAIHPAFNPAQVTPSNLDHTVNLPSHPVSSVSSSPGFCSVSNSETISPYQPSSGPNQIPPTVTATNSTADTPTKCTSEPGSYSTDESLYEISEEEMREIDASLASNPDVMASRQWKYYMETNEWTRATCALMACLFTRDQMANSTVLGRGGSQRARLPSNLVAYVVVLLLLLGTIRKRFNKPAAAVRARMAQKCKDERRFGRMTVSGGPSACGADGSQDPGTGTVTPVAALSGKNSGSSRRSRKRAATSTSSSNGVRPAKSSNSNTPPSDFASTPGYQPTVPNDDACSSNTDSNQLPPIALSPSTDPDQDLYGRSATATDECLQLPPITSQTQNFQNSAHTLSMMLMVPSLDVIQSGAVTDQSVLSSGHLLPSTELAS
ncbi:unnamed protein product [Calicophoron daubneyi]|uniref:Uncharacterized protein n=1 Tax=Calicophoron daubneyi TaxID=300641 RepID=A0AAV2TWJ7_CALDB